jgi:hypothetical protein
MFIDRVSRPIPRSEGAKCSDMPGNIALLRSAEFQDRRSYKHSAPLEHDPNHRPSSTRAPAVFTALVGRDFSNQKVGAFSK